MRKIRTGELIVCRCDLLGRYFGCFVRCIGWCGTLVVPEEGLEPTWIAPADFKSAASADSATPALYKLRAVGSGCS